MPARRPFPRVSDERPRLPRIIRLTLAVALGVTTTLGAAAVAAKPKAAPLVLNIGHRGASGLAPEHTIAAYDLALKLGADYIEQDLQITSDGVLVVLHDTTLERTARGPAENCTGPVNAKTLAQIKTCDVGSWFNERFPEYARSSYVGLRIPTLEEVFQRYGRKVNYHIETKSPEQAPGMEEELLRLMNEYDLRDEALTRWRVLIQSFSPASLVKIHELDPELPLVQLFPGGGSAVIRATLDAVARYAVGIGPSFGNVDAALVEAAHARCLDLHPYTVNETADMQRLIALGVDGMFTNFPDRLDAVLGKGATQKDSGAARAASEHAECQARPEHGEESTGTSPKGSSSEMAPMGYLLWLVSQVTFIPHARAARAPSHEAHPADDRCAPPRL